MIALSADATPAALQQATRAGFSGYLTKPLHLRKLFDALERAVGETAA
jgi:CheY-like chemotaxis protein